ncbi:MAG: undecaprenyl-phosphate glucose phosphotransferase [Bacteroidales bacterium]|jgi:putative colanic acid biosynthesis UDP-glucose lipid carrier transferase|nr:undecaprenyl-phosphate glucose phosphotransferase [Bacteroidales bacterium]
MKEVGRYKIFISTVFLVEDMVALNLLYFILLPVFKITYDPIYSLALLSINLGYLLSIAIVPFADDQRRLRMQHLIESSFYRLSVTALIFLACLFTVKISGSVSRLFIAVFFSTAFFLLVTGHLLTRKALTYTIISNKRNRKAIILGAGLIAQKLYKELTGNSYLGIKVLGFFEDDSSKKRAGILGTLEDAKKYAKEHQVTTVYCTLPLSARSKIIDFLNFAELNVINFHIVPSVGYYTRTPVVLETVGSMPILSLRKVPLSNLHNAILKRSFDIIVSFTFLVTLFPVIYLLLGIAIKSSSRGPVFFVQERTGKNGEIFRCYKFRSMLCNNEAHTKQATVNDHRKTWIGAFIRRSNLDELPQFINVLKGEMSIVGPRPHMLRHTEEYSQMLNKYMVRHFIKPGITGWAQINGFRGETKTLGQMEGRVKKDIWYLENWTLLLDIVIIIKTILLFFKGDKNAY